MAGIEVQLQSSYIRPGQRLKAFVTFKNYGAEEDCAFEWCTAYLTGVVIVNPSHAKLPAAPVPSKADGAIAKAVIDAALQGENNWCLFATEVVSLAHELTMKPNTEKKVLFTALLPNKLPPSHRGVAMRIMYTFVIATQIAKQRVETLRVPFYVMAVANDDGDTHMQSLPYHLETKHSFAFEVVDIDPKENLNSGVGAIMSEQELFEEEDIGEARSVAFNISRGDNRVVLLTLMRTLLRVGHTVVGTLDFSCANIGCHQVTHCLIGEEIISEECRVAKPSVSGSSKPPGVRQVVAEGSQISSCLLHTDFVLYIPGDASPCFVTPIASYRWLLKLEFTIDAGVEDRTETLVWETPLTVLPASTKP